MTTYRIAPGVAWVDDRGLPGPGSPVPVAYLTRLPDGPALVLADSSWAIWSAVAAHDELPLIAAHVADLLGLPDPGHVEDDVRRFLDVLISEGLVEQT